jgi:outer membrane murein-binding lipoprotein Lpp
MTLRLRFQFVLILAMVVPLGGCLFRSRKATVLMSTAQLKNATFEELVEKINQDAAKIQTLNSTVDIAAMLPPSPRG